MIENDGITIIRANPDTADFNINKLITKYIDTSVNQMN